MCSFGFHSSCLLSWTFSSYVNLDWCHFFFVPCRSYFLCKNSVCYPFIVNIYHSLWSEAVNYSDRHDRRNVQAGKSFFHSTNLVMRLCKKTNTTRRFVPTQLSHRLYLYDAKPIVYSTFFPSFGIMLALRIDMGLFLNCSCRRSPLPWADSCPKTRAEEVDHVTAFIRNIFKRRWPSLASTKVP